jgi:hypothetical protein
VISSSNAGGLVGASFSGEIQQSYASGPVFGGAQSSTGGLVGLNTATGQIGHLKPGKVSQSYAVSPIHSTGFNSSGGLVGQEQGSVATNSYWDRGTTARTTSAGGTGETTVKLQVALPLGFGSPWNITKNESYPYLFAGFPAFASALATTVVNSKVYTFLPIGQHEPSEYASPPLHADAASLATVYTILARAVGITDGVALLDNVKIDKYFWHDTTQTTTYTGPVATHLSFGNFTSIGSGVALGNVIGKINAHNVVILRGTYFKGHTTATHYMLATLYTKNSNGTVSEVIANDPWTGQQVEINPSTKKVLVPANFPLANFTVSAYQAVTLH